MYWGNVEQQTQNYEYVIRTKN